MNYSRHKWKLPYDVTHWEWLTFQANHLCKTPRLCCYRKAETFPFLLLLNHLVEVTLPSPLKVPDCLLGGGGVGWGTLGLKLPLPIPFTPVSPPPSIGVPASLFYFCCDMLSNIEKFFGNFSRFLPPWESRFLPPHLLHPPNPYSPGLLPPVPLHFFLLFSTASKPFTRDLGRKLPNQLW